MANYYVYISPKNIDAFQMYVTWGGTRISYSKSNATVVGDYLRCTLNVTSQAPNKIEISSAGYVNMTFDNPTFTQSGSDYSFYITLQEPPAHLYKWYNKTERCTFWTDTDKPTTSAHIYNSDGLDLTEKYVGSVSFKSWAFSYASMLRMVFRFTASFSGDYWYHVPGPRYVHTPGSYDFVYDRDSTGDLVWDSTNNRYNVESTGQACHYCSIEYLYGWTENTNTLTLYTQNLSRSEVILDSLRLVDTNLNVDTDYDTNKIVGNVLNSAGVAWENSNSGQFKIIPDDLSRIALNKSPCIFEDKDGNDILENLNNYTTFNFILVRNVGLQFMYSMGKYPIDYNVNLLLLKLDSDIYIVSGFHDESAYSSCGIDIASVFAPLSYITSYFTASSEYFPIDVIPGLLDCTGSGVLAYMNPSNNWNTYVNLDIVKFFGLLIDSANNTDLIFNIYTSPEDMNLNIKSNTIIDHSSDTIGDTIAAIYDNTNFTRNKLQDLKWNYSTGVYDLVFPTTPRESLYGWKETTTSDILYTKSATAVVGMPLYTESGEDANLVIDTVNANTITASIPLKSYNVTYDNTSYTAQAVENSGLQITASTKTEIDLGSDFTVTEI